MVINRFVFVWFVLLLFLFVQKTLFREIGFGLTCDHLAELYLLSLPHKCGSPGYFNFFHTPQSESPNSIHLSRLRRPPRHISLGERN
jgi:hypothetical protein